jgi:hypothetical protein
VTAKYFHPSIVLPTLTSATASAAGTNVTVVFSEAVSAATAGTASNYTINQGVTVSGVTVVNSTTVTLTTSVIVAGPAYTLTVNGVSDWAGNAIAANSQIAISVPAPSIAIHPQPGAVSLTWTALAPYQLQSATNVTGPWSYVAGATSPHTVTPLQAHQFFRLSN